MFRLKVSLFKKIKFLSMHCHRFFFTFEIVPNASFNCYPNNSLSSYTSFLPEQKHLTGEWAVAISELSCPLL